MLIKSFSFGKAEARIHSDNIQEQHIQGDFKIRKGLIDELKQSYVQLDFATSQVEIDEAIMRIRVSEKKLNNFFKERKNVKRDDN